MRSAIALALCGGLAASVAGAASAGVPEAITVTPTVAEQGSTVTLDLPCRDGDAGPVSSPAFANPVTLTMRTSRPGYHEYTGKARIADTATVGVAKLHGSCGPRMVIGFVRVAAKSLILTPGRAPRGATVTVQAACDTEPGPVTSPALSMGPLRRDPNGHQPWALRATGTVRPNAEPGPHPVMVTCGEQTLRATFTVLTDARRPQVQQPPAGGVETGDGSLDGAR